jgi:hypothetical protein
LYQAEVAPTWLSIQARHAGNLQVNVPNQESSDPQELQYAEVFEVVDRLQQAGPVKNLV